MHYRDWDLYIPLITTFLFCFLGVFFYFKSTSVDFRAFYKAGAEVFRNPTGIYDNIPRFIYLPAAALLFALLSFFPYVEAQIIFYIISVICAELSLVLLWKIFKERNTDKKIRLFALMSISGGITLLAMIDLLQSKHLVLFFIVYFLYREITKKEKNIEFLIGQTTLLVLAISFLPYMIFPAFIYFLNNRKWLKIVEKIILFGIIFVIFNFLFFIKPNMIEYFLSIGTEIYGKCNWIFRSGLPSRILGDINRLVSIPVELIDTTISLISLTLITLYISTRKKPIEEKFGLFFLLFLIFSTFYYGTGHYAVLLPPILFLYDKGNNYGRASIFLIWMLYFVSHLGFWIFFIPPACLLIRTNIIYLILVLFYIFQQKKKEKKLIKIIGKVCIINYIYMVCIFIFLGWSYTIDMIFLCIFLGIIF